MEIATRTPLLDVDGTGLKLENLQPIGSFKLRGAWTAIRRRNPKAVVTSSAGNMAQGVALAAKRLGIPATIAVPETAPRVKLEAIERLGARVVTLPFDAWWRSLEERRVPGVDGHFLHPVDDDDVIAGNGTVGLEILEDRPDAGTVLVPWGGGGLACGIAAAIDGRARVVACEVATAAPLSASLAAGRPVRVERAPSFVDGIGGPTVFPRMFEMARRLLSEVRVAPLDEVRAAVRWILERARVVAEGAGACAVACRREPAVAVVSGGNLDPAVLAEILAHSPPPRPR